MRQKFWKEMFAGCFIMMLLLSIIATAWLINRQQFVLQTQQQAAYLTQLSGYETREKIPDWDDFKLKKIVDFSKTYAEKENPEKALVETILLLGGSRENDFSSYIIQLTKHYPGAINLALKGDTSSAQTLQAKWYKDRHIRFYPFGLTLMLMFLMVMLITIVVAIESAVKSATENATESSGPDDGDGPCPS